MQLSPAIFKAYDIRGIVPASLDEEVARALGRAFGTAALQQGERVVAVGRDGRLSGPALSGALIQGLVDVGIEVIDVGTHRPERFNYPVSGYKVGKMVAAGEVDGGVLICGTGVGISLAANKVKGVRACVCSEPYSARMSKQHNNSNIIAFGARVIGVETAKMIVDEWLNAKYEGGRHQVRVDMLTEIEQTQGLKVVDEQGQ